MRSTPFARNVKVNDFSGSVLHVSICLHNDHNNLRLSNYKPHLADARWNPCYGITPPYPQVPSLPCHHEISTESILDGQEKIQFGEFRLLWCG